MGTLPLPIAAFIAGLLSFLSPCVLPLVPGYVSLISGTGAEELEGDAQAPLRRLMLNAVLFVCGFSAVFIGMGVFAGAFGHLLHGHRNVIGWITGVLIIIFGLHLTGVFKIKALYADKRMHNVQRKTSAIGAFVIGFAFAFGWTPCVGPILAGILAIAASEEQVLKGALLLTVYSAGLAVPFLLTALGVERFLEFYKRFRRHLHVVEVASGVLLIGIGILLVWKGNFGALSGYFGFLNKYIPKAIRDVTGG